MLLSLGANSVASAQSPGPAIDTLALASHARFLASDALGGRANGTPGQRVAAEYIAAQFHRLGLKPLDEGGTFLHAIPLLRVRMHRDSSAMTLRGSAGMTSIPGSLFHHLGGDSASYRSFEGPTRFVGPLHAMVGETRGMVVIADAAPGVPLDSVSAALENAGATALVVIIPDSQRYVALRHARGPHRFVVPAQTGGIADRRLPILLAHPAARSDLAASTSVQVRTTVAFEQTESWNVAARLPGTDPSRRSDHIVFVAHYDHIGIGRPIAGDSLYNGFIDNAVGVAAVLGIAETLRQRPLASTALFLLTSVEEEGSHGSAYFLARPPARLPGSIGAAINLDAGAPTAPPGKWYVEGGSHPVIASAISRMRLSGRSIEALPIRPTSDHWSFHARGIPAAFPVPGEGWGSLSEDQEQAAMRRWWRQHRPDDEWASDFPWTGLQASAAFAIDLARALDSALSPP